MTDIQTRIKRLETRATAQPDAWRVVRPEDLDSGAVVLEGETYRDTRTGEVLRRVIRVIWKDTTNSINGATANEH